mgnify:CR=1 FL=1
MGEMGRKHLDDRIQRRERAPDPPHPETQRDGNDDGEQEARADPKQR